MKQCEAMRKWILRGVQPGVLEGMVCSGAWLASKLLWLPRAAALQAGWRYFSSMCRGATGEVNHAQLHKE